MRAPTETILTLLIIVMLTACSGGGSDPGNPLRPQLEAERQARREANLQRERALTDLARLKQQQREAEKKRWDQIEARRKAEAEARLKTEAERQARVARLAAENQARLQAAEALRPSFGMVASFEPWPDHSLPIHTNLGPWADEGLSAVVSDHALFGVREDGTPWIHGVVPDTSLYANMEPRRTYDELGYFTTSLERLRWIGSLIGYTPTGQVVTGKATLGNFMFHSYNGVYRDGAGPGSSPLELSELQYRGTQAQWGDGDLLYWVKLGSGNHVQPTHTNSFFHPHTMYDCTRHSGGCTRDSIRSGPGGTTQVNSDEGVVRGMLLGPKHEAMAGTLQRDDLTAAFGGKR